MNRKRVIIQHPSQNTSTHRHTRESTNNTVRAVSCTCSGYPHAHKELTRSSGRASSLPKHASRRNSEEQAHTFIGSGPHPPMHRSDRSLHANAASSSARHHFTPAPSHTEIANYKEAPVRAPMNLLQYLHPHQRDAEHRRTTWKCAQLLRFHPIHSPSCGYDSVARICIRTPLELPPPAFASHSHSHIRQG
jgi:hypothetical protein